MKIALHINVKRPLCAFVAILMCMMCISCEKENAKETDTEMQETEQKVTFDDTTGEIETRDQNPHLTSSAVSENTEESDNSTFAESEEVSTDETESDTESDMNTERETDKNDAVASGGIETSKDKEETDNKEEDDLYRNITCVNHTEYNDKQFCFSGEGFSINIKIPLAWEILKTSANNFDITRDETRIGTVTRADGASDDWICVKKAVARTKELMCVAYIEKNGTGKSLSFRYRITYAELSDPEAVLFSLCVDYAEVSASTMNQFRGAVMVAALQSDPQIGVAASKRAQESILIIGNSFVGTSSIGSILHEMCQANSKDTEVNAISRGYARVSTYTQDAYFMEDVRSGQYGIIFVCGLYSNDESESLAELKEACKSSGTQLVIFPAHNEPRSCIDNAVRDHSDLLILDWKQEIDSLIKYGVDKWDMCIDDAHLHSTALAGFVGAHMIYRAIFDELPKKSDYTAISTSVLVRTLGKYCSTGIVSYIEERAVVFN